MKQDRPGASSAAVERHPLPVLGDARSQDAHDHDHDHDHDEDLFKAAAAQARPADGEHGYGPAYWRSIEEKLGTPEFLAASNREFPEGATEPPTGVARRDFLQLVGASVALAGLSGCISRPQEKILPYTRTPVNVHPGTPLHYATSAALHGYGVGLLATSWEGRPTKVDGNPDHAATSGGASSAYHQAITLGLYDQQRARSLKREGKGVAWRSFLAQVLEQHKAIGDGSKLRFLMEPSASPFLTAMRARVQQRFPKAKFYTFEAASRQNVYDGAQLAFGQPAEPLYDLAKADVIVSLDADFLQPKPTNLRHTRAFADRRDPGQGEEKRELNRLYVVESNLSITGSVADHRLRLRASDVHGFALALWDELNGRSGQTRAANQGVLAANKDVAKHVKAIANDLRKNAGKSVVIAGERQPAVVHAIAHALNESLGNAGQTVNYVKPGLADTGTGYGSIKALAEEITAGQVDTLVITAWNPAYTAPADVAFADLLKQVPNSLYHALHEDETAELCKWFIPATHALESWGDTRAVDGSVAIVQPLIAPLFSGVTEADVLAGFLGEGDKGVYALLKEFWQGKSASAAFDGSWDQWLARGLIPHPAAEAVTAKVTASAAQAIEQSASAGPKDGLEIGFFVDYSVFDGRFGNNPWLQEMPDPMTKMTWDNAILMSPATAREKSLKSGDLVRLDLQGKSVTGPIWVFPGHADNAVTLPLGYGRAQVTEEVARNVGYNAYAIRRSDTPWFALGGELHKVEGTHEFAITQGHWSMKAISSDEDPKDVKERPLALETNFEEFKAKPREMTEELTKPNPTLQDAVKYEGYQWAMAVDLSRCIGCSACTMACQSENNIPVVGKEQVKRGREMNWLRIDRYFRGDIDSPTVITQPVACVHCEAAPCEYVCPVNATVHSDEGLNEMVYNRCVGTRYCSNNCPYKVRRFNYLHYTANRSAVERMNYNPDVTVRARGVMEKCTYCVQRIERTRIESRVANREIKDGEIRTACEQACPTGAITFGSLHDPGSMVSKLHKDDRRYDLLHELNTRPRTGYLLRIKNPNPELG